MSRPATGRTGPRERGAVAVIVALLVPVLFAAAALAIDISMLTHQRQNLSNALDAAAQAGAYALPGDFDVATATALKFAKANDPEAAPTTEFWCVVAATGPGAAPSVRPGQVPGVCNPGTTAGARCNESICAIPCPAVAGNSCNTMRVQDDKEVAFSFAPVIGIDTGSTGDLTSTACKGSCGALAPNPMDVVVVADRTGSMSTADRNLMVSAIKGTLQTMTREQQYVALGTIGRSRTGGACLTTPSTSNTTGPWIPVPFSSDYTVGPADAPSLNTGSTLVKELTCLSSSSTGTYLASPLKASAQYLLGNNSGTLPPRVGEVRKAIIFETDGQPNEDTIPGSTDLSVAGDIGNSNVGAACTNFTTVATKTKSAGVLIITVAFGDALTASCGGTPVREVLAAAASPDPNGGPSKAQNDCGNATKRATENGDGDFFFCAGTGSELGPIFASAVNQLNPHTRLIRLPSLPAD
ncbi:pilus assembly protein TadG-related protein [Georgenia sp. SYP-B2076]|uniref:pilus assembly protein TadG-related protein n=1 Tax=Georgenia sp. SYP-B2076 TaxID=2495881 RepID=UPI000F8E41F4|nr:pilus assembly protein TadG-related protein [Georgenia sp. SYP-B2076]